MSFGKRVKRQAVRAGMRSSKQYGSICRDLGTMFPECLSVKIYLHFQHPLQRAGDVQQTFTAYDQYIRCYPYLPLLFWNSNNTSTALTGYTNIATVKAMGFDRLCGTSGANAMYRECLVVSMAHDIKIDLNDEFVYAVDGTATNGVQPPMRHFYHVFDSQGTAQTTPITQALSDTYAQQPDVKMKVTGSHNVGHPSSAGGNGTLTVTPGHRIRWRGSIWPHKAQEIPLDTYIGDKANWGDSTNLPSNKVTLQLSGAVAGLTTAGACQSNTEYRGIVTGSLCFTCLMKTPIAGVT